MKKQLRLLLLYLLALAAGPLARRPRGAVEAVLYIKPDHLGDLLLATPALAELRRRHPRARIAALVGPWSELVLRRNPDVDALLTCPFPGFERRAPDEGRRTNGEKSLSSFVLRLWSLVQPYLLLLRYAALLRAERYDLAIVGRDDHWWGAALALLAGVPLRVGFAVPECRPFLTAALPWDPAAHVTAQGLALVAASVGAIAGDGAPAARFDPPPADLAWAAEWRRAHVPDGRALVAIHPGTAGPDKLWFAERWAAVADALQAAGARLVITGGPGEEPLAEALRAHMREPAPSLAGQTSLGQLAALLRQADLVLGVDSGPLHLAAAQGARTIHLYGPGDAGRFGPWGDPARHLVLREELWCSPCGVFSACPRGLARPECMDRIAAERVVDEALRGLPS
jgi:heptosyltransferase-2/heptosyltransferase-3